MNTFKWLLKREYWEHRGGFLWAPMITGAVFLIISTLAIIAGETMRRGVEQGELQMNGVELSQLTKTLTPKEAAELGGALDLIRLHRLGHAARVMDIAPGTAGALAPGGGAIIIKLQRDADHFGPARRRERRDNRAVDPAAHGHNDPAFGGRARQIEQRGSIWPGHRAGVEEGGGVHGRAAL